MNIVKVCNHEWNKNNNKERNLYTKNIKEKKEKLLKNMQSL